MAATKIPRSLTSSSSHNRTDGPISRELFELVYDLSTKHSWLSRKSKPIIEILNLCKNDMEKSIFIELMDRFTSVTLTMQKEFRLQIRNCIITTWNFTPNNTYIIALDSGEQADSSSAYVQQLKACFAGISGWRSDNFLNSLSKGADLLSRGNNIVLVDDFLGSGTKVSRKIEWLSSKTQSAQRKGEICIASAVNMKNASNLLSSKVSKFFCALQIERGISDVKNAAWRADAEKLMNYLEDHLKQRCAGKKIENYKFGFKRTEALLHIEDGNPPNNNFPIFWWPQLKDGSYRSLLLPRI